MAPRTGKTNDLPKGYAPCQNCCNGGKDSFTLIQKKTTWRDGEQTTLYTLSHWCDKGRPLTGKERFEKGVRIGSGDINLEATTRTGGPLVLQATWNAMNPHYK